MKNIWSSLLIAAILLLSRSALADPMEEEARTLFTKFVAAQNAHDVAEVRSLLWESSQMLLFSRGTETRGAPAVAERFSQYYEGTWRLEPDMERFRAAPISADVIQILVPIAFTRGLPGAVAQTDTFLICQTYVRGRDGWRVASILPIANTQIK